MSNPENSMNGAESLARTLVAGGVDVCFANPGTSEMHFVAALDRVDGIRCVLGLFEGVVTGAADGYYRVLDRPASTLLHLGPGLANGLSNLHNAKKARSGIVNVVGEHATSHRHIDAPLSSDVEAIARPMSHWVLTSQSAGSIGDDAALAIEAASSHPGKIASLILPADISWGSSNNVGEPNSPSPRSKVDKEVISAAVKALHEEGPVTLLLGDRALRGRALELAGRIAAKTGCRLLSEANNSRMETGAGRVDAPRFSPNVDAALATFQGTKRIVLIGAKTPAAFFAYPERPGLLAPSDCEILNTAAAGDDLEDALEAIASELGAIAMAPRVLGCATNGTPTGQITPQGIDAVLACVVPENAIVVDESISTGRTLYPQLRQGRPHDQMNSMGASLGYAMPVAIGAAIAAPSRKTIVLSGDGSAMYTLQALWTMAREGLDVTIVVFANRSYEILRGELGRVGATAPGRKALDMLSLDRPALDWLSLARGHGVEAGRAACLEEFHSEMKRGLDSDGPYLVEVVM
jgi:acetolactate synthase-1/2/3 large subunit